MTDTFISMQLPVALIDALANASERSGDPRSTVAANTIGRFVLGRAGQSSWRWTADWLDMLFHAQHFPGALQRVRMLLPAWQVELLQDMAEMDETSSGAVFTAMTGGELLARPRVTITPRRTSLR